MRTVMARANLNCQPYFMHFVFNAIAKADLFDEFALPQIARWKILPDTQSFFEMWDQGDRSHAWNATPLFQMSGRILGVEPLEPGFRMFRVEPHLAGLKWAKGTVPTPHGDIRVSVEPGSIEITVPPGTEAVCAGHRLGPGRHRLDRLAIRGE